MAATAGTDIVSRLLLSQADENALFALIGNTNGSCEDEMHPNFEGMFKLIAAEMTTEELSEIGGSVGAHQRAHQRSPARLVSPQ